MAGQYLCLTALAIYPVKYEEVYLYAYKTVTEARAGIRRYLTFSNSHRPHSSLDLKSPDQAYFNALPAISEAA